MDNLITTPDVTGLPNLERFHVESCEGLEEIHSSTGRSENLVHLHINYCRKLAQLPPITRSKKLETLVIQENGQGLYNHSLFRNVSFISSQKRLTILCLRGRDVNFGSVEGELPNLQKLDLKDDVITRIDFSLLKLPRLKYLNVSDCWFLEKLLELPSSIAVLLVDSCCSLYSIGDISNCKWLWKVSLVGSPESGIPDLISEGNAIEDHYISLAVPTNQLQMEFVDQVVTRGEIFTLQLPPNWHDESCGFFVCIYYKKLYPCFTIILKPEMGKDFQFEDGQESNVAWRPNVRRSNSPSRTCTFVGYVSFKMLKRHTQAPWWNSAYNITSFSLLVDETRHGAELAFGAKLVLRKSKGHAMQTSKAAPDYSEFWDEKYEDIKTFTIQHDSNSSIKIVWTPRKHR